MVEQAVMDPPTVVTPAVDEKAKRNYVKMATADFVKAWAIATSNKEMSERTGMSVSGVFARVRALRKNKVSLKKHSWETTKNRK